MTSLEEYYWVLLTKTENIYKSSFGSMKKNDGSRVFNHGSGESFSRSLIYKSESDEGYYFIPINVAKPLNTFYSPYR